jgi:inosine triphosphate pyrophosphatase
VQLLHGYDNKGAVATCTFAYCPWPLEKDIESKCDFTLESPVLDRINVFTGAIHGQIVSPRGGRQFGWDCVFQPDGYTQTYGEMTKDLKNSISHRSLALKELSDFFKSQNST